ncbi:hypothetical protein NE237_027184 [Protea cynaroides]|uniref:Uncharacterized protein n=1 Tax=Protea cynaroides TaxID=273540 RepID=A0A9Q0GQU1_9MAGN|nr:hypothetical protein NE237_027184 [Protea cynaroides]
MSMALFSPLVARLSSLPATVSAKTTVNQKTSLSLLSRRSLLLLSRKATDNVAGVVGSTAVVEEEKGEKKEEASPTTSEQESEKKESSLGSNGAASSAAKAVLKFENPRWIGGTWDLKQFEKEGKTDWDAVIDAEVRRRKWLEDNPESSNNDDPVVFDTSIIPWWSWVKRFHLPEAELLNGRAAMIGFFMAYLVDSLTGVGLVDQMSNFFCKTLLFVAVVGVLTIRKNEDLENIKKLLEETTFYDKQWQATWQDDSVNGSKDYGIISFWLHSWSTGNGTFFFNSAVCVSANEAVGLEVLLRDDLSFSFFFSFDFAELLSKQVKKVSYRHPGDWMGIL